MAWTTPRTWTTTELVTAAMMNTHVRDNLDFLAGWESALSNQDITGFTNTSYADLDALTTAPFSSPVIVSVLTGTTAQVTISCARVSQTTAGTLFLGYRISGATTRAADDDFGVRYAAGGAIISSTFTHLATGLTAGTNTFELQAKVTSNSGNLSNPSILVMAQP